MISPVSVVVVVLPLVPVIAATLPFSAKKASSISPLMGTPRFLNLTARGISVGTPGLKTAISTLSSTWTGSSPTIHSARLPCGSFPRRSSTFSTKLLSYSATSAPKLSSRLSAPIPLIPEPTTKHFFPLKSNPIASS